MPTTLERTTDFRVSPDAAKKVSHLIVPILVILAVAVLVGAMLTQSSEFRQPVGNDIPLIGP